MAPIISHIEQAGQFDGLGGCKIWTTQRIIIFLPIKKNIELTWLVNFIAGKINYFWIGGVKVLDSWAWHDGSAMAMGVPFWGMVS